MTNHDALRQECVCHLEMQQTYAGTQSMMHVTAFGEPQLGFPSGANPPTDVKPGLKAGPRKRSFKRWIGGITALVVAAVFLLEVLRVTLGPNFHTVIDQRLYRAGQPSAAALETYIRAYGIRTVINLRGPNHGEDWFDEEEQAARRRQVEFVSVNISASDKPQEQEFRQLIQTFDHCATPVLVHCYSGSDRSGFASACYLLLCTQSTLEDARSQLSLRFGHFPWGKAGCLNQVLDQYKEWLDSQGQQHQPDRFRHWAREIYQKDDWPERLGTK
jgi:protein tyrosine phosphatase (PTP) superfamily phosphohydrolase (DUF442 family)